MFSLQNYVIIRSFLILFFAGILLGKSLPDEITPASEPSTQNNETSDSDTKHVTTPVDLTQNDKSLNVPEQLKENKEDKPVEEIKEAEIKERTNEPEKENESIKEATSGAPTPAPRTTIEFVSSIPEITNEVAARDVASAKEDEVEGRSLRGRAKDGPVDYARRLSEIRKYIRLYEDIIRKIDETLDVAAKKLDKGLGDVNSAIKNIAKSKGSIGLPKNVPKKVTTEDEI